MPLAFNDASMDTPKSKPTPAKSTAFKKPSSNAQAAAKKVSVEKVSLPPAAMTGDESIKIQASELVKSVYAPTEGDIDQMSSGISKKLVNTIFTTGAQDKLLTTDVYGKENSNVINKMMGLLQGDSANQFGIGGSKSSIIDDLRGMIRTDGGKLSLDTKGWTDRIVAEMGAGSMNGLSGALKTSLTSSLGITPAIYDKVLMTVTDTYRAYSNGDLSTARGVFNLMGNVCGDTELFQTVDLGAQANLVSGLVNQAIQLRVPEAIDSLMAKSTLDSSVKNAALQNNIDTALTSGDIKTVQLIASVLGDGTIAAQNPQAAPILMANYEIASGSKESDYAMLWTDLKTTLDKIDGNWMQQDRNGESVSYLGTFAKMSDDMKLIAATDPDLRVQMAIAEDYPSRDIMATAQKQYPLLVA